MTKDLKAVVIETFGSGNIPDNNGSLLPIIKQAFDNGILVVICSQCIHGKVALGTYETSNSLKQAGAISGYDITTEAAVAKLYYLLSKGLSKEEIKTQMETNIRGELSN